MLAAGLGLGLVVGLGLAGLTSTLVAALHVGSERLLAGFDALSGVSHARAPEESADSTCHNTSNSRAINILVKQL